MEELFTGSTHFRIDPFSQSSVKKNHRGVIPGKEIPMYVVYGTFVKPSSMGGCLALADQVLRSQGMLVVKGADGSDYLVVGGTDAVTLTIVCVPQPNGTWVVVSASSGDLGIATQVRDVIRGMIENTPVP